MLAYYGERIAERGLIGIITATSPEFVSHTAGGNAVYGTNPICFAFPQVSLLTTYYVLLTTYGTNPICFAFPKASQLAVYPTLDIAGCTYICGYTRVAVPARLVS